MLVVVGLPVLALIGLLGGVDPDELRIAYGLTLSSVWFAAGLSMLVSVHARSATGAIVGGVCRGPGLVRPADLVGEMAWGRLARRRRGSSPGSCRSPRGWRGSARSRSPIRRRSGAPWG